MLSVSNVIPSISVTTVQAATKVKLSAEEIKIGEGGYTYLELDNAKSSKVKWSSENKKIASINAEGKVKGKKQGTTTITATYKGKKYNCEVTVVAAPDIKVEVLTGSGSISSVKINVQNNSSGKITVLNTGIMQDATVYYFKYDSVKFTMKYGLLYSDSKTKIPKGSSKTIEFSNDDITSVTTGGSTYFHFNVKYKGVTFGYEYYFSTDTVMLQEGKYY
jgi:hypothetical protein